MKVAGKPILQYCIENLVKHGVREIILGTGYMHEKIESYFGAGEKFGAGIVYSVETEPLGTGGALKQAEELLDKKFFMLNGDNIADFDFSSMAKEHSAMKGLATIALVSVEDVSSYGVAKLEGKKIVEFVEKPAREKAPSSLANAGAYIIEKKAMEFLPEGFNLIERTMFPALAKKGKLFGFKHMGKWFTTDTLERIKTAEKAMKRL